MIDSKMSSIFLNLQFFDTPAEPRLVSFDISYEISCEVSFEVIWYQIRLFDIKWAHMSSNNVSYELKWHLIWAQMTPHMSSNETHLRFGKGRHRTALRVCVSTLITRGVHIDHPHTTNISGNSKWLWKFKIRYFFSFEISNEKSEFIGSWKSMKTSMLRKKSSFPKTNSYDPYGDQIWAPNSSPAPRYLQNQKTFYFRK